LIAAVGLNETEARSKKIPYIVSKYSYNMIARAIAMGNTTGFVKLIASNDDKLTILGIRALGPEASSLIEVVSYMIKKGLTVKDLAEYSRIAFPSVAEGIQECLRMMLGTSIYKPKFFKEHLKLASVTYDGDKVIEKDLAV
jgi:dihydrolipoamide dehydrogenase